MREIFFRGKCVDTGIWYEGGYIHLHKTTHCPIGDPERFPDNDIHQIVFERMTDWELPNQHLRVDVNPETVGQFTALTDKNGKKIFEGDILKFHKFKGEPDWIGFVRYDISMFVIEGEQPVDRGGFEVQLCSIDRKRCEIIGNIHDNPELMEDV